MNMNSNTNYKVLVVGCKGRETIIAKHLHASPYKVDIFNFGNCINPEMHSYCKDVRVFNDESNETNEIIKYAAEKDIDIAIIGSESYLEMGLSDKFLESGIKCFGPTQNLAQIETSKYFARDVMMFCGFESYCPKFQYFSTFNKNSILAFLDELNHNYVIKANGLCAGKGVKVFGLDIKTTEEAIQYCSDMILKYGVCLIEEKLEGIEYTLMSFTDGLTTIPMPVVKDYKRLLNNDEGEQTGGMGSISMSDHKMPFLTDDDIHTSQFINAAVVKHIQNLYPNEKYRGVIYGGFMKTKTGIKIIEFNSRFGDPEVFNILSILKNDFFELCLKVVNGELHNYTIDYHNLSTCVTYLVPNQYPNRKVVNQIYVQNVINRNDITYADISVDSDGREFLNGSRGIALIGIGNTLLEAKTKSLVEVKNIHAPLHYRNDIGDDLIKYTHTTSHATSYSYEATGVSVDVNEDVVAAIGPLVQSTYNNNVISKHGDFGGLFKTGKGVLCASTDGVGTKSILVHKYMGLEGFKSIGMDLVNHCINDVMVQGVYPMFFLDYYGAAKVDPKEVKMFIEGVCKACKEVNCVLLGGETAIMPDVYYPNVFDVVGFMVGYQKNKENLIDNENMREGDIVIAFPSVSPHTNGYSLIRKIIDETNLMNDMSHSEQADFITYLCNPHRSYYNEIKYMMEHNIIQVRGLAHITGGGLIENPPRIIPDGLRMVLDSSKFRIPNEMLLLQKYGNISTYEMYKTFNCGIGLLAVISANSFEKIRKFLDNPSNETHNGIKEGNEWKDAWVVGAIDRNNSMDKQKVIIV